MNMIIRYFLCFMMVSPFASAQTLASLVDKSRVLLVFAPSDATPGYREQLRMLAPHAAEMKDRDLVLFPVVTHAGSPPTPETLRILTAAPILSEQEILATRHRFHIQPQEFAVILLGKDGGEKLRSRTPVTMEKLSGKIDAMPMRKDEMRQRASGRPGK